ncbi:MAG: undecaprenyl diphosphate synthase family protein, partial [Deltaproteobacteria bacterium]|nr:undecaprenyl diphosphate synthase family protein [Deltaproteobacteria bacterium]
IAKAAQAACRAAMTGDLKLDELDTARFETFLESSRMLPPLDLLVRTSGERRISNFFLWEIAYAELYFTEKLWPEFERADLEAALRDFGSRERRFGLTSDQVSSLPPPVVTNDEGGTSAASSSG